jgi:neutral amino acid transport system permease protein
MDIVDVLLGALSIAIGVPAAAYALAAVGLNVHYGYTGLLNFGHVGFMMVGAYGTAIAVDRGLSLPLGFLCGMGAAVVLGLLLGVPTLRLRADYLAIVTIASAEILRLVARTSTAEPYTKGVFGIQRFATPFYDRNPYPQGRWGVGAFEFSDRQLWVMTAGWGMVVLCTLLVHRLVKSPWGRVLQSIREDEDAARSLGKPVFWFKLQSLMLGGVIGSLAGILLAVDRQAVNPDSYISVFTFFVYAVLILGGPGKTLGPIVGAIVFWFVIDFTDGILNEALDAGWLGDAFTRSDVAQFRFVLVGLGLILLMVFRPQGIFGNREELLIRER